MVLLNQIATIGLKVLQIVIILLTITHQPVTHRAVTHLAITHQAVTHQAVTHQAVTHQAIIRLAVTRQVIIQLAITHRAISHLLITHLNPYKVMTMLCKILTAKLKPKEFARGYHTEKFVRQSPKRLVQPNLLRNVRKSAKILGYATNVTK